MQNMSQPPSPFALRPAGNSWGRFNPRRPGRPEPKGTFCADLAERRAALGPLKRCSPLFGLLPASPGAAEIQAGRSRRRVPAKRDAAGGEAVCLDSSDENLMSESLEPRLCRSGSNPFLGMVASSGAVSAKHTWPTGSHLPGLEGEG